MAAKNFELPKDHVPGMRVPRGGSSCATCKYLDRSTMKTCTSEFFIKAGWEASEHGPAKQAGSNIIPLRVDEYCSDWYEPR